MTTSDSRKHFPAPNAIEHPEPCRVPGGISHLAAQDLFE